MRVIKAGIKLLKLHYGLTSKYKKMKARKVMFKKTIKYLIKMA